ncbi:MAG: hypothetical protein WC314_02305 [Vulcanimicrobiota bacterium]
MSKSSKLVWLLLATLFLSAVAGAESKENDGWERVSRFNSFFRSDSLVHITGEVTNIDRAYRPLQDMSDGLSVTVKTSDGKSHLVAVGPTWFTHFYKKKWDIAVGDRVDVRGSEVTIDGKTLIMAVWGRKGDLEMTVRNRHGRPVWDLGLEDF